MATLRIDPSQLKFWWSACPPSHGFEDKLPLTYIVRSWDYKFIAKVSFDMVRGSFTKWEWNVRSEYGKPFSVPNDRESRMEMSFENMLKIEAQILTNLREIEEQNQMEAERLLAFKTDDLINPPA